MLACRIGKAPSTSFAKAFDLIQKLASYFNVKDGSVVERNLKIKRLRDIGNAVDYLAMY